MKDGMTKSSEALVDPKETLIHLDNNSRETIKTTFKENPRQA
jgi:hypothetical protein